MIYLVSNPLPDEEMNINLHEPQGGGGLHLIRKLEVYFNGAHLVCSSDVEYHPHSSQLHEKTDW